MTLKLREFIRQIRAARTAAEERSVVAKECAEMRAAFKDGSKHRHRNVAKAVFISMLGYNTQFAHLECVKLMGSSVYAEKRVGYLGLCCLLDGTSDILLLCVNSIKTDLKNPNQYVNGLALNCIANIGLAEDSKPSDGGSQYSQSKGVGDIYSILFSDVETLIACSNPYIRKKAAFAMTNMIYKTKCIPNLRQTIIHIGALLEDRAHGVILSAITLMEGILTVATDKSAVIEGGDFDDEDDMFNNVMDLCKKHAKLLIRALKACLSSTYSNASDYDIAGCTDPFLQCKIIRILGKLAMGDPDLSLTVGEELAQIATNTESAKNVGCCILYECIRAIALIDAQPGLRVLGRNLISRFLSSRESNSRYTALETLAYSANVDREATMKHAETVLDCLKDPDVSIRRRALDVVCRLVCSSNIDSFARELIHFLLVCETDIKAIVAGRIASAVCTHGPSRRFIIDTLLKLISLAGDYVEESTGNFLIEFIKDTKPLQNYAVHKFFFILRDDATYNSLLLKTGIYTIGEFGDLLLATDKSSLCGDASIGASDLVVTNDNFVTVLRRLYKYINSSLNADQSTQVLQILTTAVIKLSVKVPSLNPSLQSILAELSKEKSTEVQQRACEYLAMLSSAEWSGKVQTLFGTMPPPHMNSFVSMLGNRYKEIPTGETGFEATEVPLSKSVSLDEDGTKKGSMEKGAHTNNIKSGNLLDLDDILGASSQPQVVQCPVKSLKSNDSCSMDALADLLDISTPIANGVEKENKDSLDILDGQITGLISGENKVINRGNSDILSDFNSASLFSSNEPISTYPPINVCNEEGLCIVLNCKKGAIPGECEVQGIYSNVGDEGSFQNFLVEIAVPKYLNLQLFTASNSNIDVGASVTQGMKVVLTDANTPNKQLLMKVRVTYTCNGVPKQKLLSISSFPQNILC